MDTWRPVIPTSEQRGPLPPHATPRPRLGILRVFERLLLVIGLASLGYYVVIMAEAALYQVFETRELNAILAGVPERDAAATIPPAAADADAIVTPPAPDPGETLGRLEIPRLGISVVVRAGSDARTLRLAVGHIPGTSLPGWPGNVGLAGHRDTFFRRLRDIRPDDDVRFVTPAGDFTYRVEDTKVVEPSDVWVLQPTEEPTLTLVTCYPFSFVGSAPQRFIVRAELAP